MRSSMASITMKQPVLPTPALLDGDGEEGINNLVFHYLTDNFLMSVCNNKTFQYKHISAHLW